MTVPLLSEASSCWRAGFAPEGSIGVAMLSLYMNELLSELQTGDETSTEAEVGEKTDRNICVRACDSTFTYA